ncbi:argininosuccinate lyase [Clostridia bacterium]|nr:argininosuccinate lyase [Clostridia bacterium]
MTEKLWAGRFEKELAEVVNDFNSSLKFDKRLWREDVAGSMAHAEMLGERGIIAKSEADKLVEALKKIDLSDIPDDAEDVHMGVEAALTARLGETGKRLHTARSRNDQVALDFRCYVMNGNRGVIKALTEFQRTILTLAEAHLDTIMPGYTHLQRAQPITLAHHLMAWCEMLKRDVSRLEDANRRMDESPLGAGALAGTTYDIDREFVAEKLRFSGITANSMDSVSDRDFAIETLAAFAILMSHLSRMAEETIFWTSREFGFAALDDAYSTGSSIMPQKKNPDVAELVRGKTGRVFGSLMGLLTVMKGIPLAYNKDMQEDKEQFFDALDTVSVCLRVFPQMLATLTFDVVAMRDAASKGFLNATDAADYLVGKGMAFRDAYTIIGKLVRECSKNEKTLETIELSQLREFSELFGEDFYPSIALENCVARRNSKGGPSRSAVEEHIAEMRVCLDKSIY